MSNLYPVIQPCDTCKNRFQLRDMMRRWRVIGSMNFRDHYCMPCWSLEIKKDEKKDSD